MASESFVLIVDQETLLVAAVDPSSLGGELLYPEILGALNLVPILGLQK